MIQQDPEQIARQKEQLTRQLGRIVITCLEDGTTEDLVLNPDSTLWVKRTRGDFTKIGAMTPTQAQSAFGTIAAMRGTIINHDQPILETELPLDGSRFEAILPPVVRRPVFAIRQRPRSIYTLEDYEAAGILTDSADELNRRRHRDEFVQSVRGRRHGDVIREAVAQRKNILIVGSTGSGKTTLVNAILHWLTQVSPRDRVLVIEDTPELQCSVHNSVTLLAVGS
ncbi:MAG: ATPase, T2SS/T4P/T4SS family, partial [Terriglobales bacterium]